MCWKIATIYIMAHLSSIHADLDYMALLSETLRTRHRLGCTISTSSTLTSMTLRCPPGTTISVTLAHYTDRPTIIVGNHSPRHGMTNVLDIPRCPASDVTVDNEMFNGTNCTSERKTKWREVTHGSWGRVGQASKFYFLTAYRAKRVFKGKKRKKNRKMSMLHTSRSNVTIGRQYSLLQTVVEACQKKRQCRVVTSQPKEQDPCSGRPHPLRPRFVELAYKCRPYEFRSTVACDGEKIALTCNPGRRVAVYSATYGRTEYETFHCPQPSGVPEETCVAEGGIRGMMRACHGRRSCMLTVVPELFIHPTSTRPCKHVDTKPYLYVVYTCVPRKVLAEEYEVPLLPDEDELPPEIDALEEGFDKADFRAAFSPSPNLVGPQSGNTDPSVSSQTSSFPTPLSKEGIGLTSDEIPREEDAEDEGMFYVWIGVCSGILMTIGAILARLVFHQLHTHRRHHHHHHQTAHVSEIKYQGDIAAIETNLDLASLSSISKKRNVPHLVEDTISYKDMRFPLTSVSTGRHGVTKEADLRSKNDVMETAIRTVNQSLFYPA